MSKRRGMVILIGALMMLGGAVLIDRRELVFTGYATFMLGLGMICMGLTWEAQP